MDKRDKETIVWDLERRVYKSLPKWQEKATLEAIDAIENVDSTDEEICVRLQIAQHHDLAFLFLPRKERHI